MNITPFNQNLLLWRRTRGLTQAQLAARAHLPQPNLCAIERGRRDVSLRTLRALAVALDVRPGVLADGEPPREAGAVSRGLDRAAFERVAAAAAGGRAAVSSDERKLVERLRRLLRHHLLALRSRRSAPVRSGRAANLAWIELEARYPKVVIQSLVQRTLEYATRSWNRHKSTGSSAR